MPKVIHGCTSRTYKPPEYRIWISMLQRCYNTKARDYPMYGGRNIVVCDQWRRDFSAFLRDMGIRPDGMSLDRRDNDGPYSPENCRWATPAEQARNRRNNNPVWLFGASMTTAEWAETCGLNRETVVHRVRRGMPLSLALIYPIHQGRSAHSVVDRMEKRDE